jgi:dienelactone hydrolase
MTETRAAILEGLGSFPETPAPDAETVAVESADGFERRLIEYAVEPDERIRAYLLVPDDVDAPAPGVLAIHQHNGEFALGKSEPAGLSADAEKHYGAELARRGYVVLCPDLLCFEDRQPPEYERMEGSTPDGEDYERFVAMDRLLRGSTLQAKYLSDLAVALDVLAADERVDADALGALGHSLGGQEAIWLSWYDDRVGAAVSSCGAARLSAIQRETINHNFAMYVPGALAAGDTDDLLAGVAPTPLFATNGVGDGIFPVDSVRKMNEAVAAAYADAGVPERFESLVFDGGHGFPDDVRERAYDWLDRWLRDRTVN